MKLHKEMEEQFPWAIYHFSVSCGEMGHSCLRHTSREMEILFALAIPPFPQHGFAVKLLDGNLACMF